MDRSKFAKTAAGVRSLIALAVLSSAWVALSPAEAQVGLGRQSFRGVGSEQQPVLLTADEVSYDRDLHIVTARGHVEITSGERLVRADVVNYNELTKVVTASGHVTLMEPTGDVVFGNYMELTDDLKNGVIQDLRAILQDRSRMAAVSGRRADANTTTGRGAVYSPCELCRDDPTAPPLWQLKAARITHNQDEKEVSYRDAWLEMGGVPIAYTPYLEHPDGTQGRTSGFLAPGYAASTATGTRIPVPYYQVIDNSSDITFIPVFIPGDTPLLAADYRQRTQKGYMDLTGSFVEPESHNTFIDPTGKTQTYDWRGHVKGDGLFDIDNNDRWGFNVARATDRYYLDNYSLLSRFQFQNYNTLTSRVYAERFFGPGSGSYAAVNTYSFQGLSASDDPAQAPNVLPSVNYNYIGERGPYGQYYTLEANSLEILRRTGTEDQRLTAKPGWHVPYITNDGQVYSLDATVQADVWHDSGITLAPDPFNPTEDGYTERLFPQLALGWRDPFIRRGTDWQTIVEPIVSVDIGPNMGTQGRYPNEDSRGVTFDATNLFSANRFPGYDRVDGGQRISYGVNTNFSRFKGGNFQVFGGQSYRLEPDPAMPTGTGLNEKQSSYITRVIAYPHPWFGATLQGQFDPHFSTQVINYGVSTGPPNVATFALNYVYIKASAQPGLTSDVKEISPSLNVRLTPHWRLTAYDAYDLGVNSGNLIEGLGAIYEDECLILEADVQRRFIGTVNNPEETFVSVRLIFRNLGEIDTELGPPS
jgi:LPS-assembly protein